jgi:hypothetical protein
MHRSRRPVPIDGSGTIIGTEFRCHPCGVQKWFTLQSTPKGMAPVCDDCDRRMEPVPVEDAPKIPVRDILRAAERPFRPVWLLAGVAGLGVAVEHGSTPGVVFALGAPVVGELARRITARWRARRELAEDSALARRVGYAAAAASAWLAIPASVDTGEPVGAALAGGSLLAAWLWPAGAWWKQNRDYVEPVHVPTPVDDAAPVGPPEDPDERYVRLVWAARVAAKQGQQVIDPDTDQPTMAEQTGKLVGTFLENWQPIKGGWSATVVGPVGAYDSEKFTAVTKNIAAAYRTHRSKVTVMPDPDDENRAIVMVQKISPLNDSVRWAGPDSVDAVNGTAEVGRYMDGSPLIYELYRRDWGCPHEFICGTTGAGKALALDTPIPTPSGWTTMGALKAGDQVFDETGRPCYVTHAFDVRTGRPCYEVEFSDGTVIVADADHLWKTTTQRGQWQRGNLDRGKAPRPDKRTMLDVEPVTTRQIAETLKVRRGDNQPDASNHAIDVCGPLEYPKQDLPLAPYTLGAWLGDGTSLQAAITTPDPEVLDQIRADGYRVTDHKNSLSHGILAGADGKPVRALLRGIGVFGNKHIPEIYLRASVEQRRALLAGLLDTDGTCGKTGQVVLALTCRPLVMDAVDLIQGLGYKASVTTKRVPGRCEETSTCYSISFTPNDVVFRLPRKAARQRSVSDTFTSRRRYIVDVRPVASVPVRCIAVDSPSHLFLASRACIPTHNSESLSGLLVVDRYASHIGADGVRRGIVADLLIDPQQGQSYEPFMENLAAPVATTLEEAFLLVEALRAEMLRRNAYLSRKGWKDKNGVVHRAEWTDARGRTRYGRKWWDPLIDGPLIILNLDEAHEYLAVSAFAKLVATDARKYRKCGIKFRVATHTPLLNDLGGSTALRDMLTGGFVWMGRVANSLSGPVAFNGRLPVDPRSIPEIPGAGFTLGRLSNKPMMSRFMWEPDYYDYVRDADEKPVGFPAPLPPHTLEAFNTGTGGEFDRWVAAVSAGEDWVPGAKIQERIEVAERAEQTAKSYDAVLDVLAAATGPVDMNALDAALKEAGTPFSTRTLRDTLKKLRDEGLVVSVKGHHKLTAEGRTDRGGSAAQVDREEQLALDGEGGGW